MTRRLSTVVVLFVGLLLAASGATAKGPSLVGIVGKTVLGQQLVPFDPQTLQPLAGKLALNGHRAGWSFSPSHRTLVLGKQNPSCTRGATTLRFVDVWKMQALGDLPVVRSGHVRATVWIGSQRVLALIGPDMCPGPKNHRLVSIDASSRRVLATTVLDGPVVTYTRTPGGLAILLSPRGNKIGPATLVLADLDGKVRKVVLKGIRAGQSLPTAGRSIVNFPGLAVDSTGLRAFVVPAGERLAEVDLTTLRVRYRDLSEKASTIARLRRWLAPTASAKMSEGPTRQALWLGNGLLAVTGTDSAARTNGGRTELSTLPAGLHLVDTRDWSFRKLHGGVSGVQVLGRVLLAHGSTYSYDGTRSTHTNTGLIAYSLEGDEIYRAFADLPVGWTAEINGRGYASVGGTQYRNQTVVFDLATGKMRKTLKQPLWELLLQHSSLP
jgi:hypothetical protein